jgi:hypothetical protein
MTILGSGVVFALVAGASAFTTVRIPSSFQAGPGWLIKMPGQIHAETISALSGKPVTFLQLRINTVSGI